MFSLAANFSFCVFLFYTPVLTTGLALLNTPLHPRQHLYFQFHKNGRDVRYSVAKALKKIFVNGIKQAYGGWISRKQTNDAMKGLYEVHIFSRSYDIIEDIQFEPLWNLMKNVLEIRSEDVNVEPMDVSQADPSFATRFVLDFSHLNADLNWSVEPVLNDDTASIFSVESVEELL